jgi:hypothetical protein
MPGARPGEVPAGVPGETDPLDPVLLLPLWLLPIDRPSMKPTKPLPHEIPPELPDATGGL